MGSAPQVPDPGDPGTSCSCAVSLAGVLIRALQTMNPQQVDQIGQLVRHPDESVRAAAVGMLGILGLHIQDAQLNAVRGFGCCLSCCCCCCCYPTVKSHRVAMSVRVYVCVGCVCSMCVSRPLAKHCWTRWVTPRCGWWPNRSTRSSMCTARRRLTPTLPHWAPWRSCNSLCRSFSIGYATATVMRSTECRGGRGPVVCGAGSENVCIACVFLISIGWGVTGTLCARIGPQVRQEKPRLDRDLLGQLADTRTNLVRFIQYKRQHPSQS